MCATPNLANFHYWHPADTQENAAINNFANAALLSDPKTKILRRPMFIMNNITKPELFAHGFDKPYCEPMSLINEKIETKHFLAPLGSFQMTQGQECHDMVLKRSPQHQQQSQPQQSQQQVQSQPQSQGHIENSTDNRDNKSVIAIHNNNNNQAQVAPPKLRPYSCNECGKTFLLKHHLTTHEKTHTGERPHACIHCGKSFTHKHCLNTHLLLHSSERPYQCLECKKSFTLKHHLLTHARVHNREKPFTCTECGRSFPLKRHLVTHSKFHAGERPYICEECGESFAQKDHLVMHSRFHGFLNSFVCNDCGATFTRKFELVNHGRLHGKLPFTCPICNKEFLQKRTLVVHMRYHTGESPFACLICGESFHTKNELTLHSKTHAPCSTNPDKLSCQECGSSFNSPEALALHIKLHTGDSSLVTDLCALTASLQNSNFPISLNGINPTLNFTNHNNHQGNSSHHQFSNQIIHHVTQKPKTHICRHCSKAFSAKHGLHQHNKRHPDGTCALKTHICPTCSKGFFQKNHLLLHQRQHMDPATRSGLLNLDIKVDKTETEDLQILQTKHMNVTYEQRLENMDLNQHLQVDMPTKTIEENNTDGDMPPIQQAHPENLQSHSDMIGTTDVEQKDL